LRPPPLPPTNNLLIKSKILASRRAWGDVIRVTNDAFLNTTSSSTANAEGGYHDVYSELLAAASSSPSSSSTMNNNKASTTDNETLNQRRKEACELIALRCIAHLKLRRYVDLGKEITSLGLIPYLPPHPSTLTDKKEEVVKITDDDDVSSPMQPSPGGTEVIPLSSVATNTTNTVDVSNHSMSWKEGSIHSTEKHDRLPSWVPHGLRILAAQHMQYVDGSSKAIDVLYDMRDRSLRTEYWNTNGMDVWCGTIDNALVNAFVRKKEWRMALRTLEDMLNSNTLEKGVKREVDWWIASSGQFVDAGTMSLMTDLITLAANVELISRQILILLQCGALDTAKLVQMDVVDQVSRIEAVTGSNNKTPIIVRLHEESMLVRQAPFRRKVNEGLLLFANGSYVDASVQFHDALQSQKEFDRMYTNNSSSGIAAYNLPGIPNWKELSSPTLGFDTDPSLTVECLNNLALCLLYSGNMRRAVHELEGLVRENPTMYLTEGMAFNLCTLYELGSDGEECTKRKKILQRVAKRFYLHDVGVESFRLN